MKTKAQEAGELLKKHYENSEDEVVFFIGTNKNDDTINAYFNGKYSDVIDMLIDIIHRDNDLRKIIEIALLAVKAKEEANKEE